MMLAAPNRLGILAGYTLAAMARAGIVGVLLFAVALATGMQVGGDGVDLFGLIVLALIVNVTAAMWAAGVAMRLRTIQAGPLMQMPVFLVLFMAPVYVPLALLSGWVHAVARLNPFTALVEGGRDLIAGTDVRILAGLWRGARVAGGLRGLGRARIAARRDRELTTGCSFLGFTPFPGEGSMHRPARALALAAFALFALAAPAAAAPCDPFTAPQFGGHVPTPKSILGFDLGKREVTTAQSDAYLGAVDGASDRVVTGTLARTVQGRDLRYAIVGHPDRVTDAGLATVRANAAKLMDPDTSPAEAAAIAAADPAILWIAGNVHGTEESGADAALRMLYELADREDCAARQILDARWSSSSRSRTRTAARPTRAATRTAST